MLLLPKLVSEISLLSKPCQEKSATPVKTGQEKLVTRSNSSGKKRYSAKTHQEKNATRSKINQEEMLLSSLKNPNTNKRTVDHFRLFEPAVQYLNDYKFKIDLLISI